MSRVHIFKKFTIAWAMMVALLYMVSCDNSLIFEGEGDCGIYYRIRFKYDYNIKFADAFANEVNSVALYVFDENDVLVDQIITSDKAQLASGDFEIPLELQPQKYTLLAWAGLENEESFHLLADTQVGVTTLHQMQVKMRLDYDEQGNPVVEDDLKPLFHGTKELIVNDNPGVHTETLSLMKNTNVIRVLLHELSGKEMSAEKFVFEITADNGFYNWDNAIIRNQQVTYTPWSLTTGAAELEQDTRATTSISVVLAEHTIGRMSATSSPVLHVKNRETGELVFRIPIADYALLVKGNYRKEMSDQEYLDRQDEYSMTFFLDEGEWVSSVILINSWRVVLNDTGLN